MATILVVDDAEDVAALLARLLRRWGYVAMCANSGTAALEAAHALALDLVILDYMMPDLNGIEVLRRMRADAAMARTRIVMFSAVSDAEVIGSAMASGADAYWVKATLDYREFEARVAGLIAQASGS
jgi:DNA-binding response OmpR family regulator